MPPVSTRGTLRIFVEKKFEKNGETIEYNEAYFLCQSEDGDESVLKVNTKKDLKEQLDQEGEIVIQWRDGKLGLIAFKTQ